MLDQHERPELPNWHELFAAFCGHVGDRPTDHPITRCARNLADQHQQLRAHPDRAAEIKAYRAVLTTAIDSWVAAYAPRLRDVSLGDAVDTMAAAQIEANDLLLTAADVRDESVHTAWFHLGTLADEWSDLTSSASR